MENKETNSIELFMFTVQEYLLFYNYFSVKNNCRLSEPFEIRDYVGINTKLLLLRKYGAKKEPVNIKKIILESINLYPNIQTELQSILLEYESFQKESLYLILSDGTELNLYETSENVMYGLYLHADSEKIENLKNVNKVLLFSAIREYVQKFEKIIIELFNILKTVIFLEEKVNERAAILFIGDKKLYKHNIKSSPFWSNLYGSDILDDEIKKIYKNNTVEINEILKLCGDFLNELQKNDYEKSKLKKYVHFATKKDWKNFYEAHLFVSEFNDLGLSSNVEIEKNMAYVKVFQNVKKEFIIEGKYNISEGFFFINLVKESLSKKWKIYSMGNKMENYLINK